MSERYTSAAPSRQLRDAGLAQSPAEAVWYRSTVRDGGMVLILGEEGGPEQSRALRLDECIEELTREREGGALCHDWTVGLRMGQIMAAALIRGTGEVLRHAATPVEAAGFVLLALLLERTGGGA